MRKENITSIHQHTPAADDLKVELATPRRKYTAPTMTVFAFHAQTHLLALSYSSVTTQSADMNYRGKYELSEWFDEEEELWGD